MENPSSHDSANYPYQHTSSPRRQDGETDGFETSLWKENHGNVLLGFTAILCLLGVTIIACQQSRFLPPRFPRRIAQENEGLHLAEPSTATGTQIPRNVRTVELRILGAASDEGTMKIAMYLSPAGFNDPSEAFEVDSWQIVDGVCAGRWEVSPEIKRAAIAAYHDANDNGELDRNAIGIPSERYGFSADARGFTGPPTFEEAAITLDDKPIYISIR